MFEQSVLEVSAEMRKRKRWTAVASFVLEALAVAVLLSVPLLHTEALPSADLRFLAPHARYSPEPIQLTTEAARPRTTSRTQQVPINPLIPPQRIPQRVDMRPDPTPAYTEVGSCVGCTAVPGGDRNGVRDAVMDSMLKPPPVMAVHRVTAPVTRESHAQESLLIRRVQPAYPRIAIEARIQGTVLLQATISREGAIQNLQVVSGPPMLVRAAAEAVMQWRYRPYVLNGEPVEVQTQVTVHFTLGSN
ncbi:MAG TPA: energy transducer TonB [Candidatus Koribacter sp.]